MKKIIVLHCFLLTALSLIGVESDKYEAYATINYFLKLNKFEKAENLIDSYLEKYSEDPFILTEKAFILKDIKNDHKAALKLLKKSLAIFPGYYYSNYLYAELLFLYRTSGETLGMDDNVSMGDEAIKHLKISTEDNDKFYDSSLLLGIILSDKGEYKESNHYLEKAGSFKEDPQPYFYMAFNYTKLKDVENELESYKKVLSFNPYNFEALTALSQYYLKHGNAKEAVVYLEKLFLRYPKNKKISFDYLYSLFITKEVDRFLEVSDRTDILSSTFLIFARALFLSQKECFDEAEELLSKTKNRSLKANLLLADIHMQKKDYYHAYKVLESINDKIKNYFFYSMQLKVLSILNMNQRTLEVFDSIKINNTIMEKFSFWDYYIIISAYGNLNKIEPLKELIISIKKKMKKKSEPLNDLIDTMECFLKEDEIKANSIKFDENSYLIINLYKKQKKYLKVISLLKKMLKIEKDPGPYLELCYVYIEQQDTTKAETLIKKMRKIFPLSVMVKNLHAYLLAVENRGLEYALKLSEYTLSKDGESPAYLDTYGYILFKIGRIEDAVTYLEKAYQKHPFEPEIIEHLVNCYRLKNDTKRIIDIYQLAINNDVDFKDQLIEKIKKTKEELQKQTD